MHPIRFSREVDRRRPRVDFRLPSPELRQQLEDLAQAHSTNVSSFVQTLVLEALRKEQEQEDFEETAVFFG